MNSRNLLVGRPLEYVQPMLDAVLDSGDLVVVLSFHI